MLVSVFGTPSPLTYWTLHTVRIVMQAVHGDHSVIHAFRAGDVWEVWNQVRSDSPRPVVIFADCPEGALCDAILSMGEPIIFVIDEPEDVVSFLVSSREMKAEHTLRVLSQCASSLAILSGANGVWSVRNDQYRSGVRDYVGKLIDFCGLRVDAGQVELILFHLIADYRPGADEAVGSAIMRLLKHANWPRCYEALDAEARSLTERVGTQYSAILKKEPVDTIIWPREIFPNFDSPDQFLAGPQQMVGRARYLVLGPYFHLPRGRWDARIEIEVDENLSGNEIRSDLVCGDEIVSSIKADLPKRGIFAFDMAFEVTEPSFPIEVRVEMLRGAIEGVFLLRKITFVPLTQSRSRFLLQNKSRPDNTGVFASIASQA